MKDEVPTAASPAPQFSKGSAWHNAARPMNDDFNDDGVERRPNFYSMPHGNWARLKLKGWKIHHTSEKNWARGIHLEHDGWQISDSMRGLIVKARVRNNWFALFELTNHNTSMW